MLRSRLSAIPDLDLNAGMRFFRGKLSSYVRLLRLFIDVHSDDVQRIAELIQQGALDSYNFV